MHAVGERKRHVGNLIVQTWPCADLICPVQVVFFFSALQYCTHIQQRQPDCRVPSVPKLWRVPWCLCPRSTHKTLGNRVDRYFGSTKLSFLVQGRPVASADESAHGRGFGLWARRRAVGLVGRGEAVCKREQERCGPGR